jgi:hypothetical protein
MLIYATGAKVEIEGGVEATILSANIDRGNASYNLCYWNNGTLVKDWLPAFMLKAKGKQATKRIGFKTPTEDN